MTKKPRKRLTALRMTRNCSTCANPGTLVRVQVNPVNEAYLDICAGCDPKTLSNWTPHPDRPQTVLRHQPTLDPIHRLRRLMDRGDAELQALAKELHATKPGPSRFLPIAKALCLFLSEDETKALAKHLQTPTPQPRPAPATQLPGQPHPKIDPGQRFVGGG